MEEKRIHRYWWTINALRSVAKISFCDCVVYRCEDYAKVQQEISETTGDTTIETRKKLAGKVFNFNFSYDAAISQMFLNEELS